MLAIWPASSRAASSVASAGTTRVTSPAASASAARIDRPVRISSMARAWPIARVSRCVPPAPGMTPIRISGWPKVASSPATIMSQAIASSQPPPSANPRTAAMTGVRIRQIRSQAPNRPPACERRRGLRRELLDVGARREGPAARPGQDDRPAARIGIERLEGVGQLVEEVEAQRVERSGPVERDQGDARRASSPARADAGAGAGNATRTWRSRSTGSRPDRSLDSLRWWW